MARDLRRATAEVRQALHALGRHEGGAVTCRYLPLPAVTYRHLPWPTVTYRYLRQALHALDRHEEALAEMTELQRTFGSDAQVTHAAQRASFEVRKAKRPDYYGLLGVPTVASVVEVKAAYKQQALLWHPDKHGGCEEARKAAEGRFKLLGEALEVLGDDFTRKLYNEGYDKEGIAERVQAASRAASNHNKDGCCGGGGCH